MVRSAVTICVVEEARKGPFVFHDDWQAGIRAAAELGFDAVELFAPSPDALPAAALKSALSEIGLPVAAVGTGAGWLRHKLSLTSPDDSVRKAAVEFIAGMIDWAASVGAPAIIGSMQGRHGDGVSPEQARDWLRQALDQLGERAGRHQQVLIYEPLNRYETNLANTLVDGSQLLNSLSTSHVRLLADLFHMNIEETNLDAALRQAGPHVGHVHFVDSNRRPAGAGHLDFRPIAQALHDIEYAGYLSAECFPWPDSLAAAKQTIESYRTWFPQL